jgi:hypothetical protein
MGAAQAAAAATLECTITRWTMTNKNGVNSIARNDVIRVDTSDETHAPWKTSDTTYSQTYQEGILTSLTTIDRVTGAYMERRVTDSGTAEMASLTSTGTCHAVTAKPVM